MSNLVHAIVVVSFALDHDEMRDQLPQILEAINPSGLPYFGGAVRVAVDEPNGEKVASRVIDYLERSDEQLA